MLDLPHAAGGQNGSAFAMVALTKVALSRQHLSHLIVDAINHTYGTSNRPMPSGIRYHSIRSTPGGYLCRCPSTDTFSRIYWVNVATPHPLGVVLLPESSDSTLRGFVIRIPRDFAGISHSVLKAPPLAVRRDEIERKLRM